MNLPLKPNKVKVQVLEQDRSRFQHMLSQFQYLISDIESTPLEYLENGKDFYCFIAVPRKSQFSTIIEVLIVNGFKIISNDKNVKETIDTFSQKYTEELAYYTASLQFKKDVNKTHDSLDKLVDEGNYVELIKIVKDVRYSPDTILKAKANISRAVTNAIIRNLEKVSSYKISVEKAVKELLYIASDKQLTYYNCSDLMIQAANVAFELCTKNRDAIKTLVKISNQKHLDSLINLKAAAKFGEIAFSDEKKYDEHLRVAVRELNIRWLLNLIEPFRGKLSEEENYAIDRLVDRISGYFK